MDQDNTLGINFDDAAQAIVDSRQLPTLLMQAEPRLVVTANKRACELFNKDLIEIDGYRGGQVFNCTHSFTEKGCGLDENCKDCRIKNAVVDTFVSGQPHENVATVLDIKQEEETVPYAVVISTEKTGDFVLLTVIKYDRES